MIYPRQSKVQQRAIELTPDKHADLPAHLSNHGALLSIRFVRNGDLEDISEAIRSHQRAIQLTPDGHAEIPVRLSDLGISYLRRFEHSGNLEDISEAIKIQHHAVELTPDGHVELPTRLCNLGNSLTCRFEESRDLDDISQAIHYHQRALTLSPDGHAGLPALLGNLGNSLACRFEHSRYLDDISEAIKHQRRAIELTPDGHADFPTLVNNLGISYLSRFEYTGALDDASEAIENQRRALKLTPDGHADFPARLSNLGSAYFRHFKSTGDLEFLEKSLSNYRLAATSSIGSPSLRLDAAQRWAECLQGSPFSSSQLLDAYACIIHLLSLVSGLENTIQRRHNTLANVSQLSISASTAALSLDRPDKALEWLIEGRCIVWTQINKLRSPLTELRAHDRALADRLFLVSRELENVGSRSKPRGSQKALSMDQKISLEEQAGRHIKLAKEWDQLLATIRRIAGFEDFLRPRKCADIMRKLPDEGVIVVINIHDDRCDALALTAGSNKPLHIPLPKFSYHEAERLAKGLRGHLLRHGVIRRIGTPLHNPPLPDINLAEVLGVLWLQVVWPILDSLAFYVCFLSASPFHTVLIQYAGS
jgi:tetratricopeptide (TPR) repeat protein